MLWLVLAGPTAAEDPRTIRIGVENNSPPLSFREKNGELDGFTAEMLREIEKSAGIKFEITAESWAYILREFEAGRLDALANVSSTSQRRKSMDLSVGHAYMHAIAFARPGTKPINEIADFKGRTVGVLRGTLAHMTATDNNAWGARLAIFDTRRDAYIAVKTGSCDIALDMRPTRDTTAAELGLNNYFVGGLYYRFHIAVHPGDKQRLEVINEGLAKILQNGTFDRIYHEWIGPIEPHPIQLVDLKPYLWEIALAITLTAAIILWQQKILAERKELVRTHQVSEQKLNGAQRLANFGSWSWDITSGAIIWSDEMYRLNGYTPGTPTPDFPSLRKIYTPDSWERLQAAVKQAISQGLAYNLELDVTLGDGQQRTHHSVGEITRSPQGLVIGLHGAVQDITGHKLILRQLREGENRLRRLVQAANIGLWDWDLQTDEVYFSPEWKGQLGYADPEIPNRYDEWQSRVHPSDLQDMLAKIHTFKSGRASIFDVQFRMRHKQGSWRWILARADLQHDSAGRPVRMMGCHFDITERKESEEQKKDLEAQLRQSQKLEAIGVLAGGIAHDFNNILAGIIGYAGLAREGAADNRQLSDYVDEINHSAQRAADLVRQILTFSRAQDNAVTMAPVAFDALVKEAARLLRATCPSTIEIKVEAATGLPAVQGNVSQLHQVLINLGTNALQAMQGRPGTITIGLDVCVLDEARARAFGQISAGTYSQLKFSDTGCGIPPEILHRIFEPFFTTKTPGEGTGLGLSVVHGIVNAHQGAIRLHSEVDRGTTFVILLPVSDEEVPAEAMAGGVKARGRGQRILIVDDERIVAQSSALALRKLGYAVESETNVQAALVRLENDPRGFDLVLSDYSMPKMTGLVFAEKIHTLNAGLPVILMSGNPAQFAVNGANGTGIREVMAKPFTMEILAQTVARHLANI